MSEFEYADFQADPVEAGVGADVVDDGFADFELPGYDVELEPAEEPEPWRLDRAEWEAMREQIAASGEALSWLTPREPVGEQVRTDAQQAAVGEATLGALLEQFPEAQREQIAARAADLFAQAREVYGAGPEFAVASMIAAGEQIEAEHRATDELAQMVEEAARTRALDPAELNVEKLAADVSKRLAELQRDEPDLGPLAIGLAVVDAVLLQDPRHDPTLESKAARWGLASDLVEQWQQPAPVSTEHDYRQGGSVDQQFFGKGRRA